MQFSEKISVERDDLHFSKRVREDALKAAGNRCSARGCDATKNLELHHRLTLQDYLNQYSWLPPFIIRSIANCEVYCTYHHSLADKESRKPENAELVAYELQLLAVDQGRLHPTPTED